MHIGNFNIEDYQKKKNFDYLGCNLETNVLNAICSENSHKIEVVKSIVVSVQKREQDYFFTHFHLKWALECLGFAFSLSLDSVLTIKQAISIYNTWLTDSAKRPQLIGQNESFYQKEMLAHLTLLFIERPFNIVHVELCAQVLKLIRLVIRKGVLLKENYPYLLQLLLLSFSNILSKNNEFSKKIGGDMSSVLFESFIRSEVRDAELWNEIVKKFSTWITNTGVNDSWVSVTLALSKKVLYHLYGEGSEVVLIEFKDEGSVSIDIPIEHAVLAWNYLVINVLEATVKDMFDSQTHIEFVRSVSKIADVFIQLSISRCESREIAIPPEISKSTSFQQIEKLSLASHVKYKEGSSTFPIPNVISMISIFGDWLFNQSRMNSGGSVSGQAEAIGTICRIFSHSARPIPDAHIGKFYQILFKHFKYANETNYQVAGMILNHAIKILIQDYKGVRILLHKSCIFKVMDTYVKSSSIPQQVKKDCYQIIATVVPALRPYKKHGVISIINDCLLHAISAEADSEFLVMLFWSVCNYLTMADDKEVVESMLRALLKKLISGTVESKCYKNCVKVFSAMPFMIFGDGLVGGGTAKETVEKLILPLLGKNIRGIHDETHFHALNLLVHWIMKFPSVLRDSSSKFQIFETLSTLKNFEKDTYYTQLIESYILNYSGHTYPETRLAYNNTSVISPCVWGDESVNKLKHFILKNDVVISIWNTEQGAIVIIRNRFGKFIWKFQPVIGNGNLAEPIPFAMPVLKKPKPQRIQSSDPVKVTELIKDLTVSEAVAFEKLSRLFKSSMKNTQNFSPEAAVPTRSSAENTSPQLTYVSSLFSCLGFFYSDLISDISALSGPGVDLLIKDLDFILDKEMYTVPLLYLHNPESLDFTIKLESYPRDFTCLIKSLGLHLTRKSECIIHSHKVQDLVDKYGAVIYTKELHFELAIVSPALFDMKYETQVEELLAFSQMVIIWNQRFVEPETLKVPSFIQNEIFLRKNVILLTPLRNKIVRVNVFGKDGCEPLMDNMIVPIYMLGKYIAVSVATLNCNYTTKVSNSLEKVGIFKRLKELGRNSEGKGKLNSVLSQVFKD